MNDESPTDGCMTRKRFILLTATSLATAGCGSVNTGGANAGPANPRVVDAGPASAYTGEGIHENFREHGFFLTRRQGKLIAISSFCTHRHCKLDTESDRSFSCPCHGSTFDPAGKVTEGPATRDLPVFPLTIDSRGHAMVTVS